MPASIKLQQEYEGDLAVIFVESQGTSEAKTESFIMGKGWFGNDSMWTHERPLDSGIKGLPQFVLLSADGKVLAKGNSMTSRDKDLIAEEIDRAKGAPEGADKAFKKAWKEFAKGNSGKAIAEARKLGEKKPELADEATSTIETFEARLAAQLKRVEWMLANGYPSRAEGILDGTLAGLKGVEGALVESARELETRFSSEEIERELEADKKIGRALEKLFEDGRDEKLFEKVEKVAGEFAGTKVAERALRFTKMRG